EPRVTNTRKLNRKHAKAHSRLDTVIRSAALKFPSPILDEVVIIKDDLVHARRNLIWDADIPKSGKAGRQ
ncbi:hypothetical protein AKJ16_DCAP26450, partial [Drosera capensis]